jgi:hypothetical protein
MYNFLKKILHFKQNSQTPTQKTTAVFIATYRQQATWYFFQSGSFYFHHFGKTQPGLILKIF